ncbi:LLM class flavin-dependent oxidoreductase [Lapillicoccus sp.]|uniref:LLM class flavin-dependent oxidoreductase n=1 Tax=Lapillicoccus sp. TaxID=1909287 RepID=UPI0025D1F555|nr:LLM class flavin-dependent oxidoreductase [Lapillicoccus sp.]
MRFGLTILPEITWREAAPRWRAAEELGFDHAWTYDHLVWGGLPESPWYGTTPTLTAAAMVTSRIRLGTFVVSPNYRHPVAFHRDVQSLDDISGGRFLLGVGTGGDLDSGILGGAVLTTKERVERFHEFTRLLLRLRDEDHVTSAGTWFSAADARTLPRVTDVPILIAANGPRSLRFAARYGDGWITTGAKVDTLDAWYAGLAESARLLDEALVAADRDPTTYPRYLNLDSSPRFSLESADLFTEMVGRADGLGFTDVITHWPRADGPYAGSETVLETIGTQTIPSLRA